LSQNLLERGAAFLPEQSQFLVFGSNDSLQSLLLLRVLFGILLYLLLESVPFSLQLSDEFFPGPCLFKLLVELKLLLPNVTLELSDLLAVGVIPFGQLGDFVLLLGCSALVLVLRLVHGDDDLHLLVLLHLQQHFEAVRLLAELVRHQFIVNGLDVLLGVLEGEQVGVDFTVEAGDLPLVLFLFAPHFPPVSIELLLSLFVASDLLSEVLKHLPLFLLVHFCELEQLML
jgi:hypothetical protein